MERKKEGAALRPWQRALAKSPEAWVSYLLSAAGLLWKLAETFHTAEYLRSVAMHGFDPLWLVAAGILGLGLTVVRAERHHRKSAIQAEVQGEGAKIQVEILEQPSACHLSASKDGRRMVTFPRVAIKNISSETQKVCLRLSLDDWDAVIVTPYEPPDLFTRGGPTKLPKVIDIQPGEQLTGKIEFRIPFSEASADSVFFRLVLADPATEAVVSEFTVPLTMASYLKPPTPPP